jgi:predicted NAD-dependent protein-ADP-ribosyltransferase YbiA (DUF1768 family)
LNTREKTGGDSRRIFSSFPERSEGQTFDNDVQIITKIGESNIAPGFAEGDVIPVLKVHDYQTLHTFKNWRHKLNDSYVNLKNPFVINNLKYASVMHYYQGSKFKNGFPDFNYIFSLDSNSEISRSIPHCIGAASLKGGSIINGKFIVLRPKLYSIDKDFYKNKRNIIERELAIYAKFSQNNELQEILLNTNKCKILNYLHDKSPEVAYSLMKVRNILCKKKIDYDMNIKE